MACILFLLGSFGHQVLDVGVSKMLVRRLMRIFSYVCKGSKPKYKSRVALARAAFRRLGFLGRRSQARRTAPGYVDAGIGLLLRVTECLHCQTESCSDGRQLGAGNF